MKQDIDRTYKLHLVIVFALCLLCIIIYSNTLHSPFVFDDFPNIKKNISIRLTDFDFQRLSDTAFIRPNPTRPVANISFALNHYFGEYDVTSYHVTNIIIHLINGILVYFLSLITFKQLSRDPSKDVPQFRSTSLLLMSLFSALIFITHPIQTQSVTYIVQRMNSMAVMFYLLSLLLYVHGRLTRIRWRQLTLFCGCFMSWIMALGSKEIACTLPLIILLYEWYFFQDLRSGWLRQNIEYFLGLFAILIVVIFIYLGLSPFDKILATYANRDFTMMERVLTQFRVVVFYISLLLFPHPSRLNLLHDFTTSSSLLEPPTTLVSLLIIVGLIGLGMYCARRQRLISFCILWFIINLFIESSVIGVEMIYEHRLYLPMFGFALFVSWGLFYFFSKRRSLASVVSAVIILSLCTATYVRNKVWQDGITLWSDVVSKSPQSHRAHLNLGVTLKEQERLTEAISHFSEALRIKPDYAKTHNNLGTALARQGKLTEAIGYLSKALQIQPDYAEAHNNLGTALARQGKLKEAVDYLSEALRIKPDFADAHYNLGNALNEQGKVEEAVKHFSEALRIEPDSAEAHNNLGNALKRLGKLDEAINHFSEALRIKPDYAEAYNNLGTTLTRQGKFKEAVGSFSEALRIKPDYAKAHFNLGNALKRQGKLNDAINHFSEALRIRPDYVKAYNNLGTTLTRQGKFKEAAVSFYKALRIAPDSAGIHYNLGIALKEQGRLREAVKHFSEALRIKPNFTQARYSLELCLRQISKSAGASKRTVTPKD
jgi:tetratricopeptide (TPR) repeat protein